MSSLVSTLLEAAACAGRRRIELNLHQGQRTCVLAISYCPEQKDDQPHDSHIVLILCAPNMAWLLAGLRRVGFKP